VVPKCLISPFGLQARVSAGMSDRQRLIVAVSSKYQCNAEISSREGTITFDLPCHDEGDGRKVYSIPPPIQNSSPELLIRCAEGIFGVKKHAVVVCSTEGGSLRPYRMVDSRSTQLGVSQITTSPPCHALFSVPETVVTLRGDTHHQLYIVSHSIVERANSKLEEAAILSQSLFDGDLKDFPHNHSKFKSAIHAVLSKALAPTANKVWYAYTD
jgi:hypothetical protein